MSKYKMTIKTSDAALNEQIDRITDRYGLQRTEQGVYIGTGSQHDFARFGRAILAIKEIDGILSSAEEWLFFEGDTVEDVVEHYRKKK
ncbi:MAG: hypothetical protein ACRC9L_03150 [Brevinema sp.]